jgi:hypothetical protein
MMLETWREKITRWAGPQGTMGMMTSSVVGITSHVVVSGMSSLVCRLCRGYLSRQIVVGPLLNSSIGSVEPRPSRQVIGSPLHIAVCPPGSSRFLDRQTLDGHHRSLGRPSCRFHSDRMIWPSWGVRMARTSTGQSGSAAEYGWMVSRGCG